MSAQQAVYFDCFSGASGDMLLGALIDSGLDCAQLVGELEKLMLPGWQLQAERVRCYGVAATDLRIEVTEPQLFRYLPDILSMLKGSSLPPTVQERCVQVFQNLACAEAEVHGIDIDKVHFHEVGALDSIIDIVGTVCALHLLGIDRIFASPLPLGHGKVKTEHGWLPVPVPATLALLRRRPDLSVYSAQVEAELVTPTGAALLTSLVEKFGLLPPMHLETIGSGNGKRDLGYPNILRAIIGRLPEEKGYYQQEQLLLESNIDDLNPELYDYVLGRLFAAGALDVYFTPVQMKKNRPAIKLSVLTGVEYKEQIAGIIFQETSALGVRCLKVDKMMLPRFSTTVKTAWGDVRMKVAGTPEKPLNAAPEYEDCRLIAAREKVPLKEVYKEVDYCWRRTNKV